MAEEFLADVLDGEKSDAVQPVQGDREAVKIMVIGSQWAVTTIIHTLYHLGFAQVSEWSKLQIEPVTGKFMTILTRHLQRH